MTAKAAPAPVRRNLSLAVLFLVLWWPAAGLAANTIIAWGDNSRGQLEVPSGLSRIRAIAAGSFHGLALKEDGTVVGWGLNDLDQTSVPADLTNVVTLASGGNHGLALKADGRVVAWGRYYDGSFMVPLAFPSALSNVVGVASGCNFALALRADGTVTAQGTYHNGSAYVPMFVPLRLGQVVAMAGGALHALALKAEGTVVAWGNNNDGECDVPAGLSSVVAVAAGAAHCLALKADGTVVGWGHNAFGQTSIPPGLGDVVAVACGDWHSLALQTDGTVVAWGSNDGGQNAVPSELPNGTALAAGARHSLALKGDGSPQITVQPVNQFASSTTNVTLTVKVAGAPPLAYQWLHAGNPLPGATESNLTVSSLDRSQVGEYCAIVTNAFGAVTSRVASVTFYGTVTVFVDGCQVTGGSVARPDAAQVTLQTGFPNGSLFYTLDGTEPSFTSPPYVSSLTLTQSATLRAIAYSEDFARSMTALPVEVMVIPTYVLSVSTAGGGSVSASPISDRYLSNSVVTLTAAPWPGWSLAAWTGDAAGTSSTASVTMNGPRSVSAVFGTSVTTNVLGQGTVQVSPSQALVPWGSTLRVCAVPNSGFYFVRWAGAVTTALSPTTFVVTQANPAFTALFAPLEADQFALSTVINGLGTVALSPPRNRFTTGETVTLTPIPDPGQAFEEWSGDASGFVNPLTFAMDRSRIVTARFAPVVSAIVAWGDNSYGQTNLPLIAHPTAIAAGFSHNLALRRDGTVVAWGQDFAGKATVPPGLGNVARIAAGVDHSLALKADGTIVGWGQNDFGQTAAPGNLTNAVAISAGGHFSLALRDNGMVVGWGSDIDGEINVPPSLTNAVAVDAGYVHSLALRTDGTVVAWGGPNDAGQTSVPAGLTDVVAVAAGYGHSLALKGDGSVAAWGFNSNGQTNVPSGLTGVVAIAAGSAHSLALTADGTVAGWGWDTFGQSSRPQASIANAISVDGGYSHTLSLLGTGAPVIATPLRPRQAPNRSPTAFHAKAVGTPPLRYGWFHNGTAIAGATNASLLLPEAQSADVGAYHFVVSNALGSATSSVVRLELAWPPVIDQQPGDVTVIQGQSATFTVGARGEGAVTYQWQCGSTDLVGAIQASLTVTNAQAIDAGAYRVVVRNWAGAVTSIWANLTVRLPPAIREHPTSLTVVEGQQAAFSVSATGDAPLEYQWRRNGTDLAGATGSNYEVASAQPSDAGNYDVLVRNPHGSVTSEVAMLTVISPPMITAAPESQLVWVSSDATFTVTVQGTPPFTYEWRFNGTTLPEAIGSSLVVRNVQSGQAGEYTVTVANLAGSATSLAASLIVRSDAARTIWIGGTNCSAGQSITLPIYLAAQGNENAMGFSLVYDPWLLSFAGVSPGNGAGGATLNANTNQVEAGQVGMTVALPTGSVFPFGTQQVARVTFQVATNAEDITTPLSFGSQPIAQDLSDPQAASLLVTYVEGQIAIGSAYEADVAPLPQGNGLVTVTDWVKVGRYVAGLDAVPSPGQFQRADCAPRASLGNGALTVSDWVQAGRYAAGLEPLTPAGGPTMLGARVAWFERGRPIPRGGLQSAKTAGATPSRFVRLRDTTIDAGQTNRVSVELVSLGDECALGFSLAFEPSFLGYAGAALAGGAARGTLNVNTNESALGHLGLALSLPVGNVFAPGTQEVATVDFLVPVAAAGETRVVFVDQPVLREISDAFANELSARYIDGTLTLLLEGPQRLRLYPPQRQANGVFRLVLGAADGRAIGAERLARIDLLATTDVGVTVTNWVRVTSAPVLTNGLLQWEDRAQPGLFWRFYRASEKP